MLTYSQTTPTVFAGKVETPNSKPIHAVKQLNTWFIANELGVNLNKTCYMILAAHHEYLKVLINLQLNGINIRSKTLSLSD
jgi:hypothetical protein